MDIDKDELLLKLSNNQDLNKNYDFCVELSANLHTYYIDDQVGNFEAKIMSIIGKSYLNPSLVLMPKQLEALYFISSNKNVVLSATTSFGKSFLMLEYIKRNEAIIENVIYVVHTVTLQREVYGNFKKYFSRQYKVIDSFDDYDNNQKNIMVVVSDGTSVIKFDKAISLLIIDEAYNLGLKDDLGDRYLNVYSNCISLIKQAKKTILIGPFIKSFKSFNREIDESSFSLYQTEYSPVTSRLIEGEELSNTTPELKFAECINKKENTLYFINSKNIIYKKMNEIIDDPSIKEVYNDPFVKWMEDYFPPYWLLPKLMKKGISVFHSNFPTYLNNYCINKFNKGDFLGLLTTSSILEGINTSTKNIVINSDPNTKKTLSSFRFFNLCGRAGRLNKRICVGHIYNFGPSYSNQYDERKLDLRIGYETTDPVELYNLGLLEGDSLDIVRVTKERLKSIGIDFEPFKESFKMCYFSDIVILQQLLDAYDSFKYQFRDRIDSSNNDNNETLFNSGRDSLHKPRTLCYIYECFVSNTTYKYKNTSSISVPYFINSLVSSSYKGLSSNLSDVLNNNYLSMVFSNKDTETKNELLIELLKIAYGYIKYNYNYINRILKEFINNDNFFTDTMKMMVNSAYFDRIFRYLNENGKERVTRILIEEGFIPPLASKIVSKLNIGKDKFDELQKNELLQLTKNLFDKKQIELTEYERINYENTLL